MYRFKLSICIATYNRPTFLKEMLDSIFIQNCSNIEVVVIDSSNNFETKDIIDKYFFDNVNYVKLDKKGGVDKDYDFSVITSNGEYCWLLSDDDVIHINSLDVILSRLYSDDYSIIIVNAELRSKDLKEVYRNRQVIIDNDIEYFNSNTDFELFFQNTVNYMSFIGCVIINRNLWVSRNREKYFGTEFVHIGVIFQDFLPKKVLVIANPYISIRMNNSQWSERAFKIWFIIWPKLLFSFNRIDNKIINSVISLIPTSQFVKLFYYRALGVFTNSQYLILNEEFELSMLEKLKLKLILSINGTVVKYIMLIYSVIFKRKWMFIDLLNIVK